MVGIGGASSSLSKKMVDDGSADNHDQDMVQNNNFTVLVVDDDPIIRKVHAMQLKKFGLKVQVVDNGRKAIDLYCLVPGTKFNLILMDKEMPVMDGVEATKEMRDMGLGCMIVGVTSRGSADEKEEFMAAGLDFCFEKPLTPEKITFLLQELKKNN